MSFVEGASVVLDPSAITYLDPDHSDLEDREITIGFSIKGRVIFVSHCERLGRVRIISARKAAKKEKSQYEEKIHTEKS